jgi:hypothetical protein
LSKLVDSVCHISNIRDLIAGNYKSTADTFMDTGRNTMAMTYISTVSDTLRPLKLADIDIIADPELFEFFEKKITNKLLHQMRLKLAGRNENEIFSDIEAFRKRFGTYFKVGRLDSMVASLSDRDKLRAYTNLHMQPKS